ncbi:MAG: 4-(cytidine 5'-diphospho)-2-C-methyl-D-erythritol kinase [Pseudomonadota bacterium]
MTAAEGPSSLARVAGGADEEFAEEFAPAKLNLYLHLCGRREDGYHRLESLAVFPRLGDRLRAEDAPELSLSVEGPFAAGLSAQSDNLVLRAAKALAAAHARPARAALHLTKSLPVASGIGGGSADAAAALRLLARRWGVGVPARVALDLGADVPVCLNARAQVMQGIGEILRPAPRMPGFWVVLVNPLVSISTARVFALLERRDGPPGPPPPATGFSRFDDLIAWLSAQRNDLQATARACCAPIGAILEALSSAPLARMSGSGATCFALWPDEGQAMAAAASLRSAEPGWWVAAAPVPATLALAA